MFGLEVRPTFLSPLLADQLICPAEINKPRKRCSVRTSGQSGHVCFTSGGSHGECAGWDSTVINPTTMEVHTCWRFTPAGGSLLL